MNVGRPCILRGWSTLPFKICRRRLYDIRLCLPANVSNWRDIFIYLAIRKSAQVPDAVTRTCEIWHNFARTQDSLHELELIGSSSRNLKRACNNQSKLASVCTSLCLSKQARERLHEFVFINTSSRAFARVRIYRHKLEGPRNNFETIKTARILHALQQVALCSGLYTY